MPQLTWKIGAQRGMTFNQEGYCMLTDYNRPLKLTKDFCEDLAQHDPFACYQKGTAQLRMIHGELDSTASPVIARQFAEEKGAEFLLFPGAEHRLMESGNPERALQLAIEFFKQ